MLWSRVRATTICARRLGQERCDEFRRTRGPGCRREEPAERALRDGHRFVAVAAGVALTIIRQRPRPGWAMPCALDDVLRMLSFVPRVLWRDLRVLVFRQPTVRHCSVDAFVCDDTIAINAVREDEWRWIGGVHADVVRRLGVSPSSGWVRFDRELSRSYILYHVLLHESGHLVEGSDEMRAEQFAIEWECRLRRSGAIPFAGAGSVPVRRAPTRRHGWRERLSERVRAGLTAAPGGGVS